MENFRLYSPQLGGRDKLDSDFIHARDLKNCLQLVFAETFESINEEITLLVIIESGRSGINGKIISLKFERSK